MSRTDIKEGASKTEERLPVTTWQAVLRGIRNRCPRCGNTRFFLRFLKPIEVCPTCSQDWSSQRADDFPAYVSIFVTGHLMAPVIIALVSSDAVPAWALATLLITMTLGLSLAPLQPAKGAIMALLWKLGVNGK